MTALRCASQQARADRHAIVCDGRRQRAAVLLRAGARQSPGPPEAVEKVPARAPESTVVETHPTKPASVETQEIASRASFNRLVLGG